MNLYGNPRPICKIEDVTDGTSSQLEEIDVKPQLQRTKNNGQILGPRQGLRVIRTDDVPVFFFNPPTIQPQIQIYNRLEPLWVVIFIDESNNKQIFPRDMYTHLKLAGIKIARENIQKQKTTATIVSKHCYMYTCKLTVCKSSDVYKTIMDFENKISAIQSVENSVMYSTDIRFLNISQLAFMFELRRILIKTKGRQVEINGMSMRIGCNGYATTYQIDTLLNGFFKNEANEAVLNLRTRARQRFQQHFDI